MTATGSQSYVAMVAQDPANPGTIPVTPVMQKVNFLSETLAAQIATKTSDHIRDDRMTTDITTTGFTVAGGYAFEFTYENSLADEMLAAALFGEWSAGGTLTDILKNGKVYQPFFIERGHTDVDEYFKFIGMSCNTFNLDLSDQSDVTGDYGFIGLAAQVDQAIEAGATYTPVTQNRVYSTVTSIPEISIDGTPQDSCIVKSMTLALNNNITPKTGLGVLGACETNEKRLSITGAITMYFEDSVMYQRFLEGTPFSISFTLQDADGLTYIFTLPRVKLDADTVQTTGIDDDVMDNATYVALYDEATDCMLQIEKGTVTP